MKILFVENHNVFAEIVTKIFLADHNVTVVSTVSQAWKYINKNKYDIILIDYDLDDCKGNTLVRRIKQNNLPVKIIGVSSHDDGNAALKKAGADAICSKMKFKQIDYVIKNLI
ncbi:MAG: response regulator [Desulfobacteraceae bacterium]|nr:response regulator [Desulfobacteraceae bacterium]